jgi:hypothetical protein
MFLVTLEGAEELAHAWVNVRAAVRAGVRRGVAQGCSEGAEEARTKHRFKNRTGDLERSIQGHLTGSDPDGSRGEIVATEKYASFVENGRGPVEVKRAKFLRFEIDGQLFFRKRVKEAAPRPFMGLAALKCERVMIREIEIGVEQAQRILDR